MKISQLRVNNIEHPLGFQVEPLSFSWKVEEAGDAKKIAVCTDSDLSWKRTDL